MSSQQLDEEAIFRVARKIIDTEGRLEYLDQICAGDQQLRERVESLLQAHEQESKFLKSSPDAPSNPLCARRSRSIGMRFFQT